MGGGVNLEIRLGCGTHLFRKAAPGGRILRLLEALGQPVRDFTFGGEWGLGVH